MAAGGGCVAVTEQLLEEYLQSAEFAAANGFLTDVEHPTFGEVPRLATVVRLSRSAVTPGAGCLLGQRGGPSASRATASRDRRPGRARHRHDVTAPEMSRDEGGPMSDRQTGGCG